LGVVVAPPELRRRPALVPEPRPGPGPGLGQALNRRRLEPALALSCRRRQTT